MQTPDEKNASKITRKRLAKFGVTVLILLGRLLLFGRCLTSRHARSFAQAPTVPDGAAQDLVPATPHRDPDEDRLFHDVMMSFAGDCLKNAREEGRSAHFEDLHWGYTKGLIEGELEVTDTSALPAQCRVGLFAGPGTYPVVSRPNFLRNTSDTIKVSRLSLKLQTPFPVPNVYTFEGHAPELDLLLSEGVEQDKTGQQDGQGFFFRDARQLRYLSWFQAHPIRGLLSLLNSANSDVFVAQQKVMKGATDGLYVSAQAHKSWDEKDYYSAGPYALGGVLAKYALRSRQPSKADTRRAGPHGAARDQGAWFEDWRAANAPAVFDLCVQVARFGALPTPSREAGDPCKAVMATEYTDLVWDEAVSPFHPVGTLTLHPAPAAQTPRPWYFDTRDRWNPRDTVQPFALRFNAWNTLPDMAPQGQLFRARKQVHAMHRETRLRHTFAARTDPKAMCPVGQGVALDEGATE